MTLDERIAKLDDQQALSIVDSLAGEFARDDLPEGRGEQASALDTLFELGSQPTTAKAILEADTHAAAGAARKLLMLMGGVSEMRASLESWLDNPPVQETAPIPLLLAAPVVLTGCIAFLTVIGGTSIHRRPDGSWDISIDPSKKTPMNASIVAIAKILAGLGRGGSNA